MKKAPKKPLVMRRTSRLFCNDVNTGKAVVVRDFLHQCRVVLETLNVIIFSQQSKQNSKN